MKRPSQTIGRATGKEKGVRLSDGNGLFLEVTAKSKRWRARYFFEGKEQMLSLGKFPVVGLKEAREKNFLLRQQLDQGLNPSEVRKTEKTRQKEAVEVEKLLAKGEAHPMSLEAVALDWLEDVRKTWKCFLSSARTRTGDSPPSPTRTKWASSCWPWTAP